MKRFYFLNIKSLTIFDTHSHIVSQDLADSSISLLASCIDLIEVRVFDQLDVFDQRQFFRQGPDAPGDEEPMAFRMRNWRGLSAGWAVFSCHEHINFEGSLVIVVLFENVPSIVRRLNHEKSLDEAFFELFLGR